jgi:very-short-patch-repair endonuclease
MLERDFLRLMRLGGLPPPRTQVIHQRSGSTYARVDFLFEPYGVVVEVSGRKGHSSPTERQVDAQRRNELQDAGRKVFEYTYEDVSRRADHVITTMTQRLHAAGWTR